MKRITYCLTILTALLLSSCYEDKGNYDYDFENLNSVDGITFSPTPYRGIHGETVEFIQPMGNDTVGRLLATVEQSIGESIDNLDFKWTVTGEDFSGVFYTKGYVDLPLKAGQTTTYNVMLEVKDPVTTLAHYAKVYVSTRPLYKNSLFVLHGTGPGAMKLGNVSQIGDQHQLYADAWEYAHPGSENPFAYAVGMTYGAYYDFKIGESVNLAVFNNNGTSGIYNPYGLVQKYSANYVLPQTGEAFIVSKYGQAGDATTLTDYHYVIARDGRVAMARSFLCYHIPALQTTDPLDVGTDYEVTAGAILGSNTVFWDAKNQRFIYVGKGDFFGMDEANAREQAQMTMPMLDAEVDFSKLSATLSPKGKTALYAYVNDRENYEYAHAFFIFADAAGNMYRYELTPKDTKGGAGADEPAYTIEAMRLPNIRTTQLRTGTLTYNTLFSTNYLFYANGGEVVRYNAQNGDKQTVYQAPDGWSVSCIKFRTGDPNAFSGDLGRWLSIGMTKGSEGAVAEMRLTNSADIDNTVAPVLHTGFGPVVDVQFAPLYYYQSE